MEFEVDRITYSSIIIEAKSRKEAEDMLSEIDGDDDNWDYYNEEYFLKEEGHDEHAQTHTSCRDDIPLDIVNKIKELGYKIVKED